MARPKKQHPEAADQTGYTIDQGENGAWLVRQNGRPMRVFPNEQSAKKYVDYMRDRVK